MFRFEHPDLLYLLGAVPVLAFVLGMYRWWRQRAVKRVGNPSLVYRLIEGASEGRFWVKNNMVSLSLALLAVAWANPQRGTKSRQVSVSSANILIALDVSNSMRARDVSPSRMELAKAFSLQLLKTLGKERVGIIFFAGSAFMQTPLTDDHNFVRATLSDASPDYITAQGTAIPLAIELAMRAAPAAENAGGRALIIISDGENHDADAVEAAAKARKTGMRVFTVGAGTTRGGPIPISGFGGSQFKYDESGEIVISRLNEPLMREIAEAGGGKSFLLQQGQAAIQALRLEIDRLEKREAEIRSYDEFQSYYQWILLPALLLLLIDAVISWRKPESPA